MLKFNLFNWFKKPKANKIGFVQANKMPIQASYTLNERNIVLKTLLNSEDMK